MKKFKVHHKYKLDYRPQTSSQVEISNHEIMTILEKTVARSWKD